MKRKVKKVDPVAKLRLRALKTAQSLGAARRTIKDERDEYEKRVAKLNAELESKSKLIADKNEALTRRDQQIADEKAKTTVANAEVSRIVRIIDQFLSVSITPHHDHPTGGPNLPASLRRT